MEYIAAHLTGDFILQNDWMAKNKNGNTIICLIHILVYLMPWVFTGVSLSAVILIGLQHFLQDRFGLNKKWSKVYKQTDTKEYPELAMWVDQSLHIAFIWLITSLI